jgi:hypothetical protein
VRSCHKCRRRWPFFGHVFAFDGLNGVPSASRLTIKQMFARSRTSPLNFVNFPSSDFSPFTLNVACDQLSRVPHTSSWLANKTCTFGSLSGLQTAEGGGKSPPDKNGNSVPPPAAALLVMICYLAPLVSSRWQAPHPVNVHNMPNPALGCLVPVVLQPHNTDARQHSINTRCLEWDTIPSMRQVPHTLLQQCQHRAAVRVGANDPLTPPCVCLPRVLTHKDRACGARNHAS